MRRPSPPPPRPFRPPRRNETDGFQLVIDALKLNGIDTIFGLPGIPITDLTRSCRRDGLRVISFRHEQNAGYAASIAGFMTQKPGICLTVSAPGLPQRPHGARARDDQLLPDDPHQRLVASARSSTLQQGDYEEMDQLAIAKPLRKAAFRVLHAEDIGVGVARAIRAALSGRPGGVYLDLPAKLFPQSIDAEAGKNSLIKVVDPAPRQIPAPDAVKRALDLLKGAKKPLIILGKGAAYAQADADIRALVEKTGIPYLPMSMAKGLLPDTHEQSASAARSYVLPEADVVMLIGARLNWLLSQGKGKTWGGGDPKSWGGQQLRPDRHLAAGSRQQRAHRRAGRRRHRLVRVGAARRRWIATGRKPPAEWIGAIAERKTKNVAKMAESLAKNPSPMNYHSALNVVRDIVKANPDAILVNEGANALDFTRSHRRHVQAAQAPRRRHVGHHGHRHGLLGRRGRGQRPAGDRGRGRQRVRLLRHGDRDDLPLRPAGVHRHHEQQRRLSRRRDESRPAARDPSPLVFVKGARYEKLMEAFGGVGVLVTTPDELRNGDGRGDPLARPTLINAVIDEGGGTESGRITSLNPTAKKKP